MTVLLHKFIYTDTLFTLCHAAMQHFYTDVHSPDKISDTIWNSVSHLVALICGSLRFSSLLSWLVFVLGGRRPPVHLSVMSSTCPCGQSVENFPTASYSHTLNKVSCYFLFPPSSIFLPLHPLLCPPLLLVSILSVWQGSTESCNNAEEEEMKGRKGTCPTFTYSACLLFTPSPRQVEKFGSKSHWISQFIFEVMWFLAGASPQGQMRSVSTEHVLVLLFSGITLLGKQARWNHFYSISLSCSHPYYHICTAYCCSVSWWLFSIRPITNCYTNKKCKLWFSTITNLQISFLIVPLSCWPERSLKQPITGLKTLSVKI